jgi:hypothetical protein
MDFFQALRNNLFGFAGGEADPRLSPEANMAAGKAGLLNAGLQTIISASQGARTGEAVAGGILGGRQAGAATRAGTLSREQAQAMASIFANGEVDERMLRDAFGQAVATGNVDLARSLSEVLKAQIGASSASGNPGADWVETSRVDPDGVERKYFVNRLTGSERLFGQAPARSSGVAVYTGPEARQGARDKYWDDQYGVYQTTGADAANRLAQLDQMQTLLAQPGVYEGTAGNAVLSAKRFASSLGFDVEGVADAEAAQAIGNQFAVEMRALLPGPMSDGDRKFLVDIMPNLGRTAAGNLKLIEARRRLAQRDIDIAQFVDQYAAQREGRLDSGLTAAIQREFGSRNYLEGLAGPLDGRRPE